MSPATPQRTLARILQRLPLLFALIFSVYRRFLPKYTAGVVGIVFNDASEVLLVEHIYHPRKPWGLPGGWMDANEDPADTVRRELHEELQLDVTAQRLVHIAHTEHQHLDIAYQCRVNNDVGALSGELLAYRWFPLEALPPLRAFQREAIQRAHQHHANVWDERSTRPT